MLKNKFTIPSKSQLKKLQTIEKERPSPQYHAGDCPDTLIYKDDYAWVSVADKKGIYRWKKLKNESQTKTASAYFSQFKTWTTKYDINPVLEKLKLIANELKTHKIYIFPIGWQNVGNWIDYAWSDALKLLSKKTKLKEGEIMDKYSFMFYTDNRLFWAALDGDLSLQHSILNKDMELINSAFKKHFGKSYHPSKSARKAIVIKLPKIKK